MSNERNDGGRTAFTPGPWTQCDRVVVTTPETHGYATWLANCAVGGCSASEQEANARLIAAAPELLEALEALMEVERRGRVMPIGGAWDKARAAIAKATGSAE